jgi:hypothetical protein
MTLYNPFLAPSGGSPPTSNYLPPAMGSTTSSVRPTTTQSTNYSPWNPNPKNPAGTVYASGSNTASRQKIIDALPMLKSLLSDKSYWDQEQRRIAAQLPGYVPKPFPQIRRLTDLQKAMWNWGYNKTTNYGAPKPASAPDSPAVLAAKAAEAARLAALTASGTRPPASATGFANASDQSALNRVVDAPTTTPDRVAAPVTTTSTVAPTTSTLDKAQPFVQQQAALAGAQSTTSANPPPAVDIPKAVQNAHTQFRSQRSGYSGNRRFHPFSG